MKRDRGFMRSLFCVPEEIVNYPGRPGQCVRMQGYFAVHGNEIRTQIRVFDKLDKELEARGRSSFGSHDPFRALYPHGF